MNRRDFLKLGAAAGAGTAFATRNAAGSPLRAPGAGLPQGAMTLPESPGFRTKHLVTIILGNGARTKDVLGNEEHAPFHAEMIRGGTVFTQDYGETASLHGYMYTEVLTGRDAPSQRPLYPTWNEYVRKKTGAKASDFWMLQPASYYRAWTWDVKHFSRHPDYGIRYGATSLTANKIFRPQQPASPKEIVDRDVEEGLGHTKRERTRIEEFVADALASRAYELPSTRRPVIDRPLQVGDCQSIQMAGRILKAFRPKMITVQVLALDDAHADFGSWDDDTGYQKYIEHIETTDEMIGTLWREIQADPYLRDTTSLIIRPECGRNDEVDSYGQLGHGPGDESAHYVWMTALGPDFRKGHVVAERVQRRDLAPTITYLMCGENAEHATGHVRTQMFAEEYRLPDYVLPETAALREPVIDWERRRASQLGDFARSTAGYGD